MPGEKSMYQQNTSHEVKELHINAAGCTDTGRVREHNEDVIAFCEPPDQAVSAQSGWLYLLADGAGGHAAGEVASRIAVETISSVYYEQSVSRKLDVEDVQAQGMVRNLHGPLHDLDAPMMHIRRAFATAHTRISQQGNRIPEYAGMATTCIAAVVKGAHLLIAHVGDSRAYLIHASPAFPPTFTRLTTDHSLVMELVRVGALTPEQMQSSPNRHIILRTLGGVKKGNHCPDMVTCVVQAGDHLLLCCDGLWSMLTEEQIALVVRSNPPQAACDELIRLANEAGGEDNISAVVLSFTQTREKGEGIFRRTSR
jgi:serine/threonine protein phosphatase PrpC